MITVLNSSLRIRKTPDAQPPLVAAAVEGGLNPPPATDPAANKGDGPLLKLAKLAPSEVMAVYLAGKNLESFKGHLGMLVWSMVVICFLWRWMTTHEEGKATQWRAILSATFSFLLWACASASASTSTSPPEVSAILGDWWWSKPDVMGWFATIWTVLIAPYINKGD